MFIFISTVFFSIPPSINAPYAQTNGSVHVYTRNVHFNPVLF